MDLGANFPVPWVAYIDILSVEDYISFINPTMNEI